MRANTSDITVSSLLQTETEDIVVAVSARKHSFAHFNDRIFSICNANTGVLLRAFAPGIDDHVASSESGRTPPSITDRLSRFPRISVPKIRKNSTDWRWCREQG